MKNDEDKLTKVNNRKKMSIVLIICVFFICLWIGYYLSPVINKAYSGELAYYTRIAYRDNYQLHTTPMPENIVREVCKILEIEKTSEHCSGNKSVYAPDFFDELKDYFNNVPQEKKTYDFVNEKIGAYLQYCGEPSPEGYYSCRYDFIGDSKYTFSFYFDKNNYYYEVIASAGGS